MLATTERPERPEIRDEKCGKGAYRDGNCDFEEVITAQRNLHEAELDAAKTREQRVAILEKQLKSAQQSVAVAKTKFENGAGGETDMLQAKAGLLHVKIRLVRQRQ